VESVDGTSKYEDPTTLVNFGIKKLLFFNSDSSPVNRTAIKIALDKRFLE
jgi:hypothetical protein